MCTKNVKPYIGTQNSGIGYQVVLKRPVGYRSICWESITGEKASYRAGKPYKAENVKGFIRTYCDITGFHIMASFSGATRLLAWWGKAANKGESMVVVKVRYRDLRAKGLDPYKHVVYICGERTILEEVPLCEKA